MLNQPWHTKQTSVFDCAMKDMVTHLAQSEAADEVKSEAVKLFLGQISPLGTEEGLDSCLHPVYTHAHTRAHTCTHMRARTHTHTHMHTCAHTHTFSTLLTRYLGSTFMESRLI